MVDPEPAVHFAAEDGGSASAAPQPDRVPDPVPQQADLIEPSPGWRNEVVARVHHYRARRRPREPRYPSLRLKFDPTEPTWTEPPAERPPLPTRQAVAVEAAPPAAPREELRISEAVPDTEAQETAKIIEFPRAGNPPLLLLDELADPVFDRPRILEVPELTPPPPMLGGMLIEAAEEAVAEKRPGFEIPLQSAPMWRRALAGALDGVLVLAAFAGFAYMFFRMTAAVPPIQQALSSSALLLGMFWAGYQYLMLVHAGTTLGLRAARLRLSRFDGSPAPRALRRWRVLASLLSGVSLGLGYAWCFLDEDALCWHDRITHTYMAPKGKLQ
jgi:uncharacterized RDD family membrane protein YckC